MKYLTLFIAFFSVAQAGPLGSSCTLLPTPLFFATTLLDAMKSKAPPKSACKMRSPKTRVLSSENARKETADLAEKVRTEFYPELKGVDIQVVMGESSEYFLRTDIDGVLENPNHRKYKVILSNRFLDCMPSQEAISAVLVHEFRHIVDYSKMDTKALLEFLGSYGVNKTFVSEYERSTDTGAIQRAAKAHVDTTQGMIEYRKWQYVEMDPKIVDKKKRNYLSPQELENFHKD